MRIAATCLLALRLAAAAAAAEAGAAIEHRSAGVSGWMDSHSAGIGVRGSLGRLACAFVALPDGSGGKGDAGDGRIGIETAGARGDVTFVTRLQPGYPNPFNPATTIEYSVEAPSRVRLAVYGVQGELVRTLVEAAVPAGEHAARWDGANDRGSAVSSGIYFVRLETDRGVFTRKLILAR